MSFYSIECDKALAQLTLQCWIIKCGKCQHIMISNTQIPQNTQIQKNKYSEGTKCIERSQTPPKLCPLISNITFEKAWIYLFLQPPWHFSHPATSITAQAMQNMTQPNRATTRNAHQEDIGRLHQWGLLLGLQFQSDFVVGDNKGLDLSIRHHHISYEL